MYNTIHDNELARLEHGVCPICCKRIHHVYDLYIGVADEVVCENENTVHFTENGASLLAHKSSETIKLLQNVKIFERLLCGKSSKIAK